MCLSWGRCWEQGKPGLMGNIPHHFACDCEDICPSSSAGKPPVEHGDLPRKAWEEGLPAPRAASQLSTFHVSWELHPLHPQDQATCSGCLRLKLLSAGVDFTGLWQGAGAEMSGERGDPCAPCAQHCPGGLLGLFADLELLGLAGRGYCGCEQLHLYLL